MSTITWRSFRESIIGPRGGPTPVQAQLKAAGVPMLLGLLAGIIVLSFVVYLNFSRGIEFRALMQDPSAYLQAPAYTGAVSHLGGMLWIATAAISLFSAWLIKSSEDLGTTAFLAVSGAATLYLGIDDLFLLHEDIIPLQLGVSQKIVISVYCLLFLIYISLFIRFIMRHEYVVFSVSVLFLSASVFIDIAFEHSDVQTFYEDAFKLLGIIFWSIFFIRYSLLSVTARE